MRDDTKPKVDPLIWRQLPHDAQRILSGQSNFSAALNLYFNDDGTCDAPARAGEGLADALMRSQCANYRDALRLACEFTESLCRANPPRTS